MVRPMVGVDAAFLNATAGRDLRLGFPLGLAAGLLRDARDLGIGSVAVPCHMVCGRRASWSSAVAMYRAQGIRLIALASCSASADAVGALLHAGGAGGVVLGSIAPSGLVARPELTLFLRRDVTSRLLKDPALPAALSQRPERPYVYAEDPECGVDLLVGSDRVGQLLVVPPVNWRGRDATRALLAEAATLASIKGLASGAWVLTRTVLEPPCPAAGAFSRRCRYAPLLATHGRCTVAVSLR